MHRRDGLVPLCNFQPDGVLGFLFRLLARRAERFLHALLDGQVHLAPGVVEFPLLADQLGLGFLRLGELGVLLLDDFL